jgi:hypothetical protein
MVTTYCTHMIDAEWLRPKLDEVYGHLHSHQIPLKMGGDPTPSLLCLCGRKDRSAGQMIVDE